MNMVSSKGEVTRPEAEMEGSTLEINEMARVRNANKDAMDSASRQIYGQSLSLEQKSRIEMWIERMPYHWQLEDAKTARLATAAIYDDWLDWSGTSAFSLLYRLDKFERRFRIAGVAYHKIPYTLRHSPTLPYHARINNVVLARLSQVFETGLSRSQQSFFRPWNEIFDAVNGILKELVANKMTPKDIDRLRKLESGFEVALSRLANPLQLIETALFWVEAQVANLTVRSELDGSDNLAAKHSREGGLFRIWIQTFFEIEYEMVDSGTAYTEGFVDAVLGDIGVVEDAY
jgi:hypothetical protein